MSERAWRGRWWLPDREEDAVGGDLALSAEEFVLTTDGLLQTAEPPKDVKEITGFFQPVLQPVILGRTRGGDRVTLLECDGAVPVIPGAVNAGEWHPKAAILGAHLDHDPKFLLVDAELSHLGDWSGGVHISRSVKWEEEGGRFTRIEAAAERSTLGEARLGDTRIELGVVPLFNTAGTVAKIGIYPRFRVEPPEQFSWREAMDRWIRPLRDLVSFATIRPAALEHIRLRPSENDDGPGRLVELLLQLTDLRRPSQDRSQRLSSYDVLFPASELPGGFERGLGRWFDLHRMYASTLTLMLSVYYAPFIYAEQRFLALAQAAESYHAMSIGGTPLSKQEHKQRMGAVASAISDPSLSEWATEVLADSNWYRLRDRLDQLLTAAGDLGKEIAHPDSELFLRRIVKTRNYLTHHGEKHALVLDRPVALFWHGEALSWLIRSLLMRELGFSPDEVAERIRRTPRFQALKKGLRDALDTTAPA